MSEFNLKKKREELFETMKLVVMEGIAKDIMGRIKFQDKEFINKIKNILETDIRIAKNGNNEIIISAFSNLLNEIDEIAGEKFK